MYMHIFVLFLYLYMYMYVYIYVYVPKFLYEILLSFINQFFCMSMYFHFIFVNNNKWNNNITIIVTDLEILFVM
jgi:hypothetical protein